MDVTSLLDPDIAALLANGPLLGPLSLDTLPASRANMRALADAYVETGAVERTDHTLTSPDGHQFAVRVHRPKGVDGPLPAIVWMHGGGLVSGTHLVDDGRFDRWCPKFGGVVGVSVDYGLAPERPYPGPLEDCYTALRWTHDHADELGIVPGRVGIGGASAGGNQAAGLALLARDRGELAVELQALIYPMLDDRMITASSSWDVPIWPPASNHFGWSAYLQGRRGADDIPAYAAPARADDVSGSAADVHLRGRARRLPRRGRRLRESARSRRRAGRAARVPGRAARLRPDDGEHRGRAALPPPSRRVARGSPHPVITG